METTIENILSLIPQRPPFVMVDKLLSSGEIVTTSTFLITADNIFVENGVLKEPGLVENIAQTAAARAGHIAQIENKPVRVGYIGAIRNLQVMELPKINDKIITEITLEKQIFEIGRAHV